MIKLKYQTRWIVLASIGLLLMMTPDLSVIAASDEGQEPESVELSEGRSNLISAPWPVAKVSIASPKIADVQIAAPDQVVVLAKSIGMTDLILCKPPRVIFAELKSEKGKLTPAQEKWISLLTQCKERIECYIWRPADLRDVAMILGGEII